MLRPEHLADLAQWLRQEHRVVVSPAQLNDAASLLLSAPLSGVAVPALGRWLAPVMCSTRRQQDQFPQRYAAWLAQSGIAEPGALLAVGGQGRRRDAGQTTTHPDKARAWWRWLLAAMFTVVLVAGAGLSVQHWWPQVVEVVVIDAEGAVNGARWSSSDGRSGTAANGGFSLRVRRSALPMVLRVEHPRRQDGAGAPLHALQQLEAPLASTPVTVVLIAPEPAAAPAEQTPPPELTPLRTLEPPRSRGADVHVQRQSPDRWRIAALLSACVLPLLGWLIELLRRRGFLERLPTDHDDTLRRLYAARERPLAVLLPELRMLGRELRRRVVVASRDLDLAASLRATLRRGGSPTPVYGTRIEPEHLVLVDRLSRGDHLARLSDEVARALHDQGLALALYAFEGDPGRCWHVPLDGPRQEGISDLEQLRVRHPLARVLLFSDGQGLFDSASGRTTPAVDTLREWEQVVVLTPQPRERWTRREWQLEQAGLVLLPLGADGLMLAGEVLAAGRPADAMAADRREMPRPPHLRDVDMLLDSVAPPADYLRQLMASLEAEYRHAPGGDAVSFAWLCGLAVYPELHWGLTLEVGAAVAMALEPESLDDGGRRRAQRLTHLARLPWLRHGHMPDWLRDALLDRLDGPAEAAVRQRIKAYLEALARRESLPGQSDELAISLDPRDARPWRDIWRGMRRLVGVERNPVARNDRVFLRFMNGGRRRNKRAFDIGAQLRELVYRGGLPLAGPRALLPLAFVVTGALAVSVWPPMTTTDITVAGAEHAAQLVRVALDANGSTLAALDAGGRLHLARLAGGDWTALQPTAVQGAAPAWPEGWLQALPGGGWAASPVVGPDLVPPVTATSQDRYRTLTFTPVFAAAAASASSPAFANTASVWTSAAMGERIAVGWALRRDADGWRLTANVGDPSPARDSPVLCSQISNGDRIVFTAALLARTLDSTTSTPQACAWSARGRRLVVADDAGKLFEVGLSPAAAALGKGQQPTTRVQRIAQLPGAVQQLAVSDDGRTITALHRDSTVSLVRGPQRTLSTLALPSPGLAMALSDDGLVLAATLADGRTRSWRLTPPPGRRVFLGLAGMDDDAGKTEVGVQALGEVLRQRYGFDGRVLNGSSGLTDKDLEAAFAGLIDLGPADSLVVMLNGTDPRPNWMFERGVDFNMRRAAQLLAQSGAGQMLVVADVTSGHRIVELRPVDARVHRGSTRVVLSSHDPEQRNRSGDTLTRALARELARMPESTSARDLLAGLQPGFRAAGLAAAPKAASSRDPLRWAAWPGIGHDGGDVQLTPLRPPMALKLPPAAAVQPAVPAAAAPALAPASDAGNAQVQSTSGWRLQATMAKIDRPQRLVFSPDSTRLAGVGYDDRVHVWEAATGRELATLAGVMSWGLAYSPDGRQLYAVAAEPERALQVINAATFRVEAAIPLGDAKYHALAVSRDGRSVAIGALGGGIALVNVAARRVVSNATSPMGADLDNLLFDANGTAVIALDNRGHLTRFSVPDLKLVAQVPLHGGPARGMAMSPDGQIVATAGFDDRIVLSNPASLKPLRVLEFRQETANSLAFSPGGDVLAAVGFLPYTVRFWDPRSGNRLADGPTAPNLVHALAWSSDGQLLALGSEDGLVHIWRRVTTLPVPAANSSAGAPPVQAPAASR